MIYHWRAITLNRSLDLDYEVWFPNVVEPAHSTQVKGEHFLISKVNNIPSHKICPKDYEIMSTVLFQYLL